MHSPTDSTDSRAGRHREEVLVLGSGGKREPLSIGRVWRSIGEQEAISVSHLHPC